MSEDQEPDKDGYLYKRGGSALAKKGKDKWKIYYVNLLGGSLVYWRHPEDQDPKAVIVLKELKLCKDDNEGTAKKFCFSLKNDKKDFLFAAEDEEEWKEWVKAIEGNMTKEPQPLLKKEKRKSRAKELAFRAKKTVLGKAAISPLGKKALRSQAPEEVRELIAAIKQIIEKEAKSSKKSTEIEDNIFKIGIKSYFLIEDKKLTIDDLLEADKPLRQSLELLSKCYDHVKFSRNPNMKLVLEKFQQVEKLLNDAGVILTKLLEPYLKPTNVMKIHDTLAYLGNPERLMKIYEDESLNEPLQELICTGEHYTQFHFYSSKKGKDE